MQTSHIDIFGHKLRQMFPSAPFVDQIYLDETLVAGKMATVDHIWKTSKLYSLQTTDFIDQFFAKQLFHAALRIVDPVSAYIDRNIKRFKAKGRIVSCHAPLGDKNDALIVLDWE